MLDGGPLFLIELVEISGSHSESIPSGAPRIDDSRFVRNVRGTPLAQLMATASRFLGDLLEPLSVQRRVHPWGRIVGPDD